MGPGGVRQEKAASIGAIAKLLWWLFQWVITFNIHVSCLKAS